MPALDPARWAALTPYLDEVLQLPDDQHAQWLTELRDREPDIAGEIEVLLARHQRLNAAGFLDGNALPPAGAKRAERNGDWSLHAAVANRPRRDGQRLARRTDRRAIRSPRRHQVPQPRHVGAGRSALSPRRPHSRAPGRLPHRAAARRRRHFVRPALSRPGIRGRRTNRRVLPRTSPGCSRARRVVPRGPCGGRACTCAADRSSRHQAVQRARDARRARQAPRLRHRGTARRRWQQRRCDEVDTRRRCRHDAGICCAGTGARAVRLDGDRRLRARRRPRAARWSSRA